MSDACKHGNLRAWRFADDGELAPLWSCADCGWRFEPVGAAPAVPAGWQMVPVEPTPEMLEAVKPFPHHLTAEHPDPADPWHWRMAAATKADQMRFASEYREALAAAPGAPDAQKGEPCKN